MNCFSKHTKYDPPGEEYICPKCESTEFFIYECENSDCEKLHDSDVLQCEGCGFETTGKKFASLLSKKKHLVTCPTCKGKGMVVESNE